MSFFTSDKLNELIASIPTTFNPESDLSTYVELRPRYLETKHAIIQSTRNSDENQIRGLTRSDSMTSLDSEDKIDDDEEEHTVELQESTPGQCNALVKAWETFEKMVEPVAKAVVLSVAKGESNPMIAANPHYLNGLGKFISSYIKPMATLDRGNQQAFVLNLVQTDDSTKGAADSSDTPASSDGSSDKVSKPLTPAKALELYADYWTLIVALSPVFDKSFWLKSERKIVKNAILKWQVINAYHHGTIPQNFDLASIRDQFSAMFDAASKNLQAVDTATMEAMFEGRHPPARELFRLFKTISRFGGPAVTNRAELDSLVKIGLQFKSHELPVLGNLWQTPPFVNIITPLITLPDCSPTLDSQLFSSTTVERYDPQDDFCKSILPAIFVALVSDNVIGKPYNMVECTTPADCIRMWRDMAVCVGQAMPRNGKSAGYELLNVDELRKKVGHALSVLDTPSDALEQYLAIKSDALHLGEFLLRHINQVPNASDVPGLLRVDSGVDMDISNENQTSTEPAGNKTPTTAQVRDALAVWNSWNTLVEGLQDHVAGYLKQLASSNDQANSGPVSGTPLNALSDFIVAFIRPIWELTLQDISKMNREDLDKKLADVEGPWKLIIHLDNSYDRTMWLKPDRKRLQEAVLMGRLLQAYHGNVIPDAPSFDLISKASRVLIDVAKSDIDTLDAESLTNIVYQDLQPREYFKFVKLILKLTQSEKVELEDNMASAPLGTTPTRTQFQSHDILRNVINVGRRLKNVELPVLTGLWYFDPFKTIKESLKRLDEMLKELGPEKSDEALQKESKALYARYFLYSVTVASITNQVIGTPHSLAKGLTLQGQMQHWAQMGFQKQFQAGASGR